MKIYWWSQYKDGDYNKAQLLAYYNLNDEAIIHDKIGFRNDEPDSWEINNEDVKNFIIENVNKTNKELFRVALPDDVNWYNWFLEQSKYNTIEPLLGSYINNAIDTNGINDYIHTMVNDATKIVIATNNLIKNIEHTKD